MRGGVRIVGALVLLAVMGAVGWVVWSDAGSGPVAPAPAAAPVSAAAAKASTTISLERPAGVDAPPRSKDPGTPAKMTPEDRRKMNFSTDDMLKVVRAECLQPWVDGRASEVELVFDVLLSDGRVMDIGMRPIGADVPADVVACVADKAWMNDWPEWDLPGELRLQRMITVTPKGR